MSRARILVHNIGHNDLYLAFESPDGRLSRVRPSGVALASVASRLLESASASDAVGADVPGRWHVEVVPPLPVSSRGARRRFDLTEMQDAIFDAEGARVVGLDFGHLEAVVEEWSSGCPTEGAVRQIVLLVTSKPDATDLAGTATHGVGLLAAKYLQETRSHLETHVLPPLTEDPFRYSSMMNYVRGTVRKAIDSIAAETARAGSESWAERVAVTISASTGTTPMISSLHEAFRDYAPDFIHIPAARRRRKDESDLPAVERYSFREITHRGAIPASALTGDRLAIVKEMEAWRDDFVTTVSSGEHELTSFWMRKGKKPVLAVLGVEQNNQLRFHRSCNLEVSLPTGSLCAERNAIGTALAEHPGLSRASIKMVAVLSVPDFDDGGHINPLGPCGACMEWLRKVAEVTPELRVLSFRDPTCSEVFIDRVSLHP